MSDYYVGNVWMTRCFASWISLIAHRPAGNHIRCTTPSAELSFCSCTPSVKRSRSWMMSRLNCCSCTVTDATPQGWSLHKRQQGCHHAFFFSCSSFLFSNTLVKDVCGFISVPLPSVILKMSSSSKSTVHDLLTTTLPESNAFFNDYLASFTT